MGRLPIQKGYYALAQPTIRPLFDTQQFQDVLLKLSGSNSSYYDEIKSNWSENILKENEWNKTLHDGFLSSGDTIESDAVSFDVSRQIKTLSKSSSGAMSLVLYSKTGMGDGQLANNPWLQEFPDPISGIMGQLPDRFCWRCQ